MGHPYPPYYASELPNTHKGQHVSACGSPGSVVCLGGSGAFSCLSQMEKTNGQFATRALEDAPGRQGGHQLGSRVPRCFSDGHYPFFPVTAPLRLVAASNGQLPNPFLCLVVLPPPALGAPKPMPTSWGGAEERAAGGGTVVPGRQLHAVA